MEDENAQFFEKKGLYNKNTDVTPEKKNKEEHKMNMQFHSHFRSSLQSIVTPNT